MKTILLTCLALFAFAGNSVLCRLALGENTIDAASFTILRLLSGVIVLFLCLQLNQMFIAKQPDSLSKGSWFGAFSLFIYAVAFSFAYISLETGVGALILFGFVQLTMLGFSVISGNKFNYIELSGVLLAFIGLVYLVSPNLSTPSFTGFMLMTLAGIAWGAYTLIGKKAKHPLSDTSYNFLRTTPFVLVLLFISYPYAVYTSTGIWYAILSGGMTSGIGYAIWYLAIKNISTIQAAVIQLLVPIVAALGGVVFVNEAVSVRLIISSVMVLGGILTVILSKHLMIKR